MTLSIEHQGKEVETFLIDLVSSVNNAQTDKGEGILFQ